jgi:CBS domain-containing protein
MKVQDLMSRDVRTCGKRADLAAVGRMMADGKWDAIPVVEPQGRVLGLITDRDISLALAERPKRAAEVRVEEVLSGPVYCCRTTDDIRDALETMQERKVVHLPVLDESGKVVGLLSLDELALASKPLMVVGDSDVSYADVAATLKAVSVDHRRRPQRKGAAPKKEERPPHRA